MGERPNFVLFMPDQLRADAVGAFGSPVARTPNIDALAARGTLFRQAFSQHSVCSPSRVSIFTGWYPHVHGHRTLTNLLKPWEPNLLKIMKDAGYNVAWAGMRGDTFASGVVEDSTDFYGFTVRPVMAFQRSPYPEGHRLANVFYYGRRDVEGVAVDLDEAAIRTAEAWLAGRPKEPWLLFVPLVFPHPPFTVEEPWYSLHDRSAMPRPARAPLDKKPRFMRAIRDRYETERLDDDDWAELVATYYGMISRVDHQLGRVMDAVERTGAAQRTATLFFTDHGEYLGDFGLIEKWSSGLDDCLLRNPVIVAAPGRRQGSVSEALVETVDLLPTVLELAGVEAPHTHFGRSLAPLLDGGSLEHRDAAFSEGGLVLQESYLAERAGFPYHNKSALQQEDLALVGKAVAVRTQRWTYVHRLYEGDELYDRAADAGEISNLSGDPHLAEVERELRKRLLDWMIETADVVPREPDPRFDPKLAEILLAGRRS